MLTIARVYEVFADHGSIPSAISRLLHLRAQKTRMSQLAAAQHSTPTNSTEMDPTMNVRLHEPTRGAESSSVLDSLPVREIVKHFADAAGPLASGMVVWNSELNRLSTLTIEEVNAQEFPEALRLTTVFNATAFCEAIRKTQAGNRHCFYSDARYCVEARNAGHPILYRCHVGLIDFVCPVFIGARHAANVYGGQIRFPKDAPKDRAAADDPGLAELTKYYTCIADGRPSFCTPSEDNLSVCSCMQGRAIADLIASVPQKNPSEILHALLLLKDIASLLSALGTEKTFQWAMQQLEAELRTSTTIPEGLATHLAQLRSLVPFQQAVAWYKRRDSKDEEIETASIPAAAPTADGKAFLLASTGRHSAERAYELLKPHEIAEAQSCGLLTTANLAYWVPFVHRGVCVGSFLLQLEDSSPTLEHTKAEGPLAVFASRAAAFSRSRDDLDRVLQMQARIASEAACFDEGRLKREVENSVSALCPDATDVLFRSVNHSSAQLPKPAPGEAAIWATDRDLSACVVAIGATGVQSLRMYDEDREVAEITLRARDNGGTLEAGQFLAKLGVGICGDIETAQFGEAVQELNAASAFDALGQQIEKQSRQMFGATHGCLWRFDPLLARYILEVVWGYDRQAMETAQPRPDGYTHELRTRDVVVVEDAKGSSVHQLVQTTAEWFVGLSLKLGENFIGALFLDFDTKYEPEGRMHITQSLLKRYATCVAPAVARISHHDAADYERLVAGLGFEALLRQHNIETHFATIDELVHNLPSGNLKHPIQAVLSDIRAELTDQDPPDLNSEPQNLGQMIAEAVGDYDEAVSGREKKLAVEIYPRCPQEGWPSGLVNLMWPPVLLRFVVDYAIANVIWTLHRRAQTAEAELKLHINGYGEYNDGNDDVFVTLWTNSPEMHRAELASLMSSAARPGGLLHPHEGYPLVRALLRRAGGDLYIRPRAKNDEADLITMRLPKHHPASRRVYRMPAFHPDNTQS